MTLTPPRFDKLLLTLLQMYPCFRIVVCFYQQIEALWNEFKVKSVGYLGTRSTVKKDKEELYANKEKDGDDTIKNSRVRKYAGIPAPEVMNRDLEY